LKPPGMTSHDVVDCIRRALPRGTRAGHLGTLDPAAAGVLPLAVGEATRWTQYLPPARKGYRAELTFGLESDTLDLEGQVTVVEADPPRRDLPLDEFTGRQVQVPPAASAIRVEGQRSYRRARRGEAVEPPPREVDIYRLEVVGEQWPRVWLDVECGPGTYVRSLARDVGRRLGCGALLSFLIRTASGPFRLEQSWTLEELLDDPGGKLLPLEAALGDLPAVSARPGLHPGQRADAPGLPPGQAVRLCDPSGALVGIGRVREGDPPAAVLERVLCR
ncbi:MAG: tRNA pseudouridine(55) synthase TruB, partial [Candidatus Eremiobacterota bacterium]